MNVAEQLVAQLVNAGVHRIYGIVGDSLNPVVDAVRKTGGSASRPTESEPVGPYRVGWAEGRSADVLASEGVVGVL